MLSAWTPGKRNNLPTSVGMYREQPGAPEFDQKSPHKRGDVPRSGPGKMDRQRISPQAWGCTGRADTQKGEYPNLPTSVGMYRSRFIPASNLLQSPHKRGDVPVWQRWNWSATRISPQAWGCTELGNAFKYGAANLPTSVGMYRVYRRHNGDTTQSPHKRGDVPALFRPQSSIERISPQAWGCTDCQHNPLSTPANLPTSVGMYRTA